MWIFGGKDLGVLPILRFPDFGVKKYDDFLIHRIFFHYASLPGITQEVIARFAAGVRTVLRRRIFG